ncbi:DNA-directed RNA polymerase subunit alpha [[Mycoplasma] mobile]|uniref:DNA-directed RNA polymerase subunit alpha n=1 Tax=Mycoplasma mobile (strain ATCC 43663 / 163K / NCTC 11711) TaxID=267748 RepID=RPOA_MYCM1|nr:DNA-directed RNA polymerase subunit alpha [[Mycoplasma] mobile]Q6KI29.1 RecName: Full=DNA-directed RNA polymerase subunit alpha; Short=RNAP subunit alpha; AltName: Full=RNA polymerase subunit alpha; AltName: Full=Transcriptase subunit alpha [Mycoplasma mobile 163K]AAT27747.1 DNA-directed RNA polymerase alpha chain [Mycoplasma mobile 163K]
MEKFIKINWTENKTKRINDFSTSFIVQPLEKGLATTLGTAIRRVLLSSISSVAPFAVKIKGVEHEFMAINKVTEDVPQILLRLRDIKIAYNPEIFEDGKIYKLSLKSNKEAGDIYAKDFILPIGAEIVNPGLLIATTAAANVLEIDVFVRAGRGYVDFEENKKYIDEIKTNLTSSISNGQYIAVDSNFSPIEKVSFSSSELNTSSVIVQEKLEMEIVTKGTIDAKNAIAQAAKILVAHLNIIGDVNSLNIKDIFEEGNTEKEHSKTQNILIQSLDLSIRSFNALKRANYTTVQQLEALSLDDLKNIKNLGEKSINEIVEKLEKYNVFLDKGEE